MVERRYYNTLPTYLKTRQNERSTSVQEDPLFEPESFETIEGQIGDMSTASQDETARNPFISERDQERQDYQLSVAVTSETDGTITSGAFYTDLIGQISSNGGDVSDHGRLFDTAWSAWTPPFDLDRWTNHQKYFWTGLGTAKVQGEYVTKEAQGSRTVLYYVSGGTVTKVIVGLSTVARASFPTGGFVGELVEDCTDQRRRIYRWNGSQWRLVNWKLSDTVPTGSSYSTNTYVYVPRYGESYNRSTVFEWSQASGRWISRQPVLSSEEPAAVEGMMWEDCRSSPDRPIYKYSEGAWLQCSWTAVSTMVGVGAGTPGAMKYDARDISSVDEWSASNWWRHYYDMSQVDRASYKDDQATRPILDHWCSIESFPGDAKYGRNVAPKYNIYVHSASAGELVDASTLPGSDFAGCTIVRYHVGTGSDDAVLGFQTATNQNGEFIFDLTLESQSITYSGGDVLGYRFWKDAHTGLARSVWCPAATPLVTTVGPDGVWKMPKNLTNNPDHEVLTTFDRGRVIGNCVSIISATSAGQPLGDNNYRWTQQDPCTGATIIDSDSSLLKALSLLLDKDLDFVDAARTMSREYSRTMNKFVIALDQAWDSTEYSYPDGSYKPGITADTVLDDVLTTIFASKSEDQAFWNSGMGVYTDTVDLTQRPIAFPPSAARIGAVMATVPRKISTASGDVLVGHDGSERPAWGDHRDDVWLALHSRFFAKIPAIKRTETSTVSSRLSGSSFVASRYYDNRTVSFDRTVTRIVDTRQSITPVDGETVFEKATAAYATYHSATGWSLIQAGSFDVFYVASAAKAAIYNGFTVVYIDDYDRDGDHAYTIQEFQATMRREFERWYISAGYDPNDNSSYVSDDPWTWNYAGAGVEGNWVGLYRRVYGTHRPHSHPWEVMGFSIQPSWWTSTWAPTSTAADGTPRYASSHQMWSDIRTGANIPVDYETGMLLATNAPVPVGSDGELLDPMAAGFFTEDSVPEETRSLRWQYGDGSPVEEAFRVSPEGRFAEALAGYLMKPARFLEKLWNDYITPIGTTGMQMWGGPIDIDVNTLRRSRIADVRVHNEKSGSTYVSNPGANSWISEKIKMSGGDPTTSFGDVIRNAYVNLGWRTAGFIDKNLTTARTPAGVSIPYEDIFVVVHTSVPRKVLFHSGVNIVRDGSGYRVYGYDTAEPKFHVELAAAPSVGGEVRVEDPFTATDGQTSFTLTKFKVAGSDVSKFSVDIDGFRVDPKFIVIKSSTVFELSGISLVSGQSVVAMLTTLKSNPSTRTRRFDIGNKTYSYNPAGSGVSASYQYGHRFETDGDVIQFLVDHGRYQHAQGWRYENYDWLDVAKRFALWASTGRETGEIFVDVPSGSSLEYVSEFGHVGDVERITNGSYSVLDIAARPIKPEQLTMNRSGSDFTIATIDPNNEIYGLRIYVQEIEHAMYFSNTTKFNDAVYDPVTGLRQSRLLMKSHRSVGWAGRMEAPGYIVYGDQLLAGFEKQAKDITRYYDRIDPIEDVEKLKQAHNLYGWSPTDYIADLDSPTAIDLDFHRSKIRYKGTSLPIKAFMRGTVGGATSLRLTEGWAWKKAEFGTIGDRRHVRFTVEGAEVVEKRQVIAFATGSEDGVIYVSPFDSTSPDSGRWILPPSEATQLEFPMSAGQPLADRLYYRMRTTIGDQPDQSTTTYIHWDPQAGIHDPEALSQIDVIRQVDPARYDIGPLSGRTVPGLSWGRDQVGTTWWDTSVLSYDYKGSSDLKDTAKAWGSIRSIPVSDTDYSEEHFVSTVPAGHGLVVNQRVIFELFDGSKHVGVIAGSYATSIVYDMYADEDPESAVLKFTDISVSSIASVSVYEISVYEWVESTIVPDEWDPKLDDGNVKDAAEPSYCQVFREDENKTYYYFWVRNRLAVSPTKVMSVTTIEQMLEDPSKFGKDWFAPMTSASIVFYSSDYAKDEQMIVDVLVDNKDDGHTEWTIIMEGDTNFMPDQEVVDRLLAGVYGYDRSGNAVPTSSLTAYEKVGGSVKQTPFRDMTKARAAFIRIMNSVMAETKVFSDPDHSAAFPSSGKTVWWDAATYTMPGFESVEATQVVAKYSDLESFQLPSRGDLVRVRAAFDDPVTGSGQVSATYFYVADQWMEVSSDSSTASVNDAIFSAGFYARIDAIFSFLPAATVNRIVFLLIHEMLDQTKDCDWFFKTSYVDLAYSTTASQPAVLQTDELPIILSAYEDTKPYHTKVRNVTKKVTTDLDEEADPNVTDGSTTRIGVFYDRRSTNAYDDWGLDMVPFDTEGFSSAPAYQADLGRSVWVVFGSFAAVQGITTYVIADSAPKSNDVRIVTTLNGSTVATPSYTLSTAWNETRIVFASAPIVGMTFSVEHARGFAGPDPVLPASVTDDFSWMTAYSSGYDHPAFDYVPFVAADRTVTTYDLSHLGDTADQLGDDADERAKGEGTDSLAMTITSTWEQNASGLDYQPFDMGPFSTSYPTRDRVFMFDASQTVDDSSISSETFQLVKDVSFDAPLVGGKAEFSNPRTVVTKVYASPTLVDPLVELSPSEWSYNGQSGVVVHVLANAVRLVSQKVMLLGIAAASTSWFADITLGYEGRSLTIGIEPAPGDTLTLTYQVPIGTMRNTSAFTPYPNDVVVDVIPSVSATTSGSSYDESLVVGDTFVDTTTSELMTWGGSSWSVASTAVPGTVYHSKRTGSGWLYDGSSWTESYVVGGSQFAVDYTLPGFMGGTAVYADELGSIGDSFSRWAIGHGPLPKEYLQLLFWFTNHSGSERTTTVDGDAMMAWYDVGRGATKLVSSSSTVAPVFDSSTSSSYDYCVVFDSVRGTGMSDVTAGANMWVGGGVLRMDLSVSSASGPIISKKASGDLTSESSGWALRVASGELLLHVDFDGGYGQWITTGADLTNRTVVTIDYDSTSASNVPTITVGGITLAVSTLMTPSGNRVDDAANPLRIGYDSVSSISAKIYDVRAHQSAMVVTEESDSMIAMTWS